MVLVKKKLKKSTKHQNTDDRYLKQELTEIDL